MIFIYVKLNDELHKFYSVHLVLPCWTPLGNSNWNPEFLGNLLGGLIHRKIITFARFLPGFPLLHESKEREVVNLNMELFRDGEKGVVKRRQLEAVKF